VPPRGLRFERFPLGCRYNKPPRTSCAIMRSVKRGFRAILLLSTLLNMPVSIVVASVFPAAQCCGCESGAECPAHRNQKSQRKNMPWHAADQPQPTCICAPDQQTQPAMLQFAPQSTVNVQSALFPPAVTHEVNPFDPASALMRVISPSGQPPRPQIKPRHRIASVEFDVIAGLTISLLRFVRVA
jgi:hypothetical protein